MSTDRTTEILNYLSAISREVGELRTEMNARFDHLEGEVARIGREQRLQGRRLDRIESLVLTTRADIDELQDRVEVLEEKQA
jgi:BMFP domain-containing protein YqiC